MDVSNKRSTNTIQYIIDIQTKMETESRYRFYWLCTLVMIVLSVVVVAIIFYWIEYQSTLAASQREIFAFMKIFVVALFFSIDFVIVQKRFSGLRKSKLETKVQKEIEKRYG